jgi:hypothetical protein
MSCHDRQSPTVIESKRRNRVYPLSAELRMWVSEEVGIFHVNSERVF